MRKTGGVEGALVLRNPSASVCLGLLVPVCLVALTEQAGTGAVSSTAPSPILEQLSERLVDVVIGVKVEPP